MPKYALDTNVYIDALRQPAARTDLVDFLRWALPFTFLSAVVVQEVLAGATSPRHSEVLEKEIVAPFARRSRIFAPSVRAWQEAGKVLAQLHPGSGEPAGSLTNDVLLALSCRENGLVLIARDRDFGRIQQQVRGFLWARPFPRPAGKRAG